MTRSEDTVEFTNVKALAHNKYIIMCRVADKVVTIPPARLLPGSTIRRQGDVGTLVVTRVDAEALGLV
jgi:hypothetical protein